jgi:rod shape-determining protein MreC
MESVLGRYRNLIILVGVLFLQVLGLATQVKRGNDQEHTRLIRIWVVGAITPFERGLVWIENGASDVWHNYFYLRGVRAENRQLKEQIEQMRLEEVRLSEDAAQARRLQSLLAFKEQYVAKTVAAQVIGTSGTDSNRVIYIDKGENAGIRRDMAVITADGIVGKVSLVYPSESQVLLINDQASGVGVILGDDRLQGWLGGTANGEVVLNNVMSDEQVPVGEKVLTSGGDRIFPPGLPAGTVVKVGNGKDLFLNIKIKPAADLSRLEEVLVVVDKQERQATAQDNVRVRAADILATRLPSVPDKPATDANAAAAEGPPKEGSAKPGPSSAGGKPALASSSRVASGTPATAMANTVSSKPVAPGAAKPSGSGNLSGATTVSPTTSRTTTPNPTAPSTTTPNLTKPNTTPGLAKPGQTAKATGQVSGAPISSGSNSSQSKSSGSKPVPAAGGAGTGSKNTPAAAGTPTSKPDTTPVKPANPQPKPMKPSVPPAPTQATPGEDVPH